MKRTSFTWLAALLMAALPAALLGGTPQGEAGASGADPSTLAPGGDIAIEAAAALAGKPGVHLVDVRTEAEFAFVGHPVGAVNIPLLRFDAMTYGMAPNPKFVEEIKARFSPDDTLLLICRSGSRSGKAAKMLVDAGFPKSYNVLEGVEGDLDRDGHRTVNGWKIRGFPYEYAIEASRVTPPPAP